jgi:hypothetical protein
VTVGEIEQARDEQQQRRVIAQDKHCLKFHPQSTKI